MITRIPQRGPLDCTICAVAMVMGGQYTYDRVQGDSIKYPHQAANGMFSAWWETYLRDEGYHIKYLPLENMFILSNFGGRAVGLLVLQFPHMKRNHIVAVDEVGIVDPADHSPDHYDIQEYLLDRRHQGAIFDDVFLAVAGKEDAWILP